MGGESWWRGREEGNVRVNEKIGGEMRVEEEERKRQLREEERGGNEELIGSCCPNRGAQQGFRCI